MMVIPTNRFFILMGKRSL